ncbi:MAG: type VI secretion system baseplate subunit TssE [Planctomycetaceae bacterium]
MSVSEVRDVPPAGLFDRLCRDAQPIRTSEAYQAAVLADLEDLLGTTRRWSRAELAAHGEVARSVLNYGAPPLTGRVVTRDSAEQLAAEVRATVLRFDPRFDPSSFRVTSTVDPDRTSLDAITLRLEGQLRGFPKPVPFLALASANLESGSLEFVPGVAVL